MADISHALDALNITGWSLNGDPKTEAEFNQMFTKHTGVDEDGIAIESNDPADFGVTWAELEAKRVELDADYSAKQYQRDRVYPSIGDQLDMIFHAGLGGDEFQAAIQAVKDAYPKPE